MENDEIIKLRIIRKLVRKRMWGGKHTPLKFLKKQISHNDVTPKELKKLIDAVIDELKTKEWLVIQRKRTGKGMDEHVWLNQSKVSEIMQFYEMYAEVE